jgi:hypothetical protein
MLCEELDAFVGDGTIGRKLKREERKHAVDGGQDVILNPGEFGLPTWRMLVGWFESVIFDEVAVGNNNMVV